MPKTKPARAPGLVLLPKVLCDVRAVEFCKALRLTASVLEPLTFSVPRVKVGTGTGALYFPDKRNGLWVIFTFDVCYSAVDT